MQTIDLPPFAPILMESTRAIGYTLEAAVADILDNSITAKANNIEIYYYPIDAYVAFLDDGTGMDECEINRAMQYGSQNPADIRNEYDLGRFGLGLKTASLSQCRCLTVLSKQGNSIVGRRWDLDHVAESKSWSLIILDEEDLNEEQIPHYDDLKQFENGTLVVWEKLDRLEKGNQELEESLGRKMDDVCEHLALVFHRYLSGEPGLKRISISMNHVPIDPIDPFITNKSTQCMDDEILQIRGEKIVIRPYILPHSSKLSSAELKVLGGKDGLRKHQGFYIYRNKRLLIWGTWFRMLRKGELSKLARVRVDIPNALDDLWTLDIKKSSAMPPFEVKENLRHIIDKMPTRSKQVFQVRGKKEDDEKQLWGRIRARDNSIYYEINRQHPLVEAIKNKYDIADSDIDVLLKNLEELLPLNSLYIDLTNDVKVNNEVGLDEKNILNKMKQTLDVFDESKRTALFKTLILTAPYNEYIEFLQEAFDKGEI